MKRLLVANRSEIAVRVFQSAAEMGWTRVALVAPGDEDARHLTFADEVYPVSSYLAIDEIAQWIKRARIDFVHPGYGFLSERAPFVKAVEAAGAKFVGPSVEVMALMGDKIRSKEYVESVGVPTLPWARVSDVQSLKREAKRIGFPLILKASAGGGGKGMRVVREESVLETSAESASREALAAFGDGTLFVERFVESPRHIEVQVFGDGKGGAIHCFERECTLQRRHQKVWEEAPAYGLPPEVRARMCESARVLAAESRYEGAGTVEFIYDEQAQDFYFLEMNTRLQVEHPVTEWVTGVDLVREQLRLALDPKSYRLPSVLETRGHSIEVRIYAEDPAQDFMPTPGKVLDLVWPTGPGIRVDSGIENGQTLTTLFDPMIAKLSVWGVDRAHAMARMKYALQETSVLGVGSNLPFLEALALHPDVASNTVSTRWIEAHLAELKPHWNEREVAQVYAWMDQQSGAERTIEAAHRTAWDVVEVQEL